MNMQKVITNIFPIATKVISDGEIVINNIEELHLNRQWLNEQLKQAGIHSVSDVFYAEVQKDGKLYIDYYKDRPN